MRRLRLYGILLGASCRVALAQRGRFLVMTMAGASYQCAGLAFVWIVVQHSTLESWTTADVTFLYGMRLSARGLWGVLAGQISHPEPTIRSGRYERYLVRPVTPLLQLFTHRLEAGYVGELLAGVALLVAGSVLADVSWTPVRLGFLVAAVIGGALVEFSLHLALAALALRTGGVAAVRAILEHAFNAFAGWPLLIFPDAVRIVLTGVFPVAFVAYLPSAVLLGISADRLLPQYLGYFTPIAGLICFLAAHMLWRRSERRYSGN